MSPRWPAAERLAGVRRGLRFLHGSTLEENLELAADIGMNATTSLDEAYAAAMERHGPDAKVVVLPYARYQLPRNAIRMEPADERLFALAGH